MSREVLTCVGVIAGILGGLLVILLPLSFQGVEYYEYGFKRRKTTGAVDTGEIYTSGRYAVGPDTEFKTFPAMAHTEHFRDVTVFTSDRLQVEITCTMQYFLRPHQLQLLHKSFDIHYQPVMSNNALDALKGASTVFSTDDFIWKRQLVEDALFKAIRERLGGNCCEKDCEIDEKCTPGCKSYSKCSERDWGLFAEVRYFQLGRLDIPDDLNDRYIQALVLQEQAATERYIQRAKLVRKETEKQVEETQNKAAEISQNATAQSQFIVTVAKAEAESTVEKARSEGLKLLYQEVKITDPKHKASFDYLRTLKSRKNTKLTVDYQQMIAGNL
jgi:regulator of protease activity HflC (stomatin/prohibitin superfamily)